MGKVSELKALEKASARNKSPNKKSADSKSADKKSTDKKNNLYLTLINVNVTDGKNGKENKSPVGSPKSKQNTSPRVSKSKSDGNKLVSKTSTSSPKAKPSPTKSKPETKKTVPNIKSSISSKSPDPSPTASKTKSESKKIAPKSQTSNFSKTSKAHVVSKLVKDQYFYHVIRQQIADYCKQNESSKKCKGKVGKKAVEEKENCTEKNDAKLGCEHDEVKRKKVMAKISPPKGPTVIKMLKKA